MKNNSDTSATSSSRQEFDTTTVEVDRRGVGAPEPFTVVEVVSPSPQPHAHTGSVTTSQGVSPAAATVSRVLQFAKHPLLVVWGRVLWRSCGLGLLLLFVAYLGHVSRDFDRFGAVRSIDEVVEHALEASERRGGRDAASSVDQKHRMPAAVGAPLEEQTLTVAKGEAAEDEQPVVAVERGCPEEEEPRLKGVLPDGRVILNEASAQELTTLPGIGPSRATAIVELRERLGRFRKVTDLLRVKGIGYKSLQKLKVRVLVDRPEEPPAEPPANEEDQDGSAQDQEGLAQDQGASAEAPLAAHARL